MPDTTAGDIRSVIKNATQGGIKRPDGLGNLKKSDGATGTGNTIATKQEIDTQRTSNTLNPRPSTPTATPTSSPIETLSNNVKSENSTIQATKNPLSGGFGGGSIFASKNTNPNEINTGGEKINNVEINGEKQGETLPSRGITAGTINSRIQGAQEQAKRDNQIKIGNAVRDLYTTAYSKLQNGEQLTYDYVREKFPEFESLSDEDLYQLASDATYLAQQGEYNLQNAFELADAYGLDTALLFDELDPKTKGEYLTYLASGKTEQSPGLLDRVIGFGLDSLGMGGDATVQDFLNYKQEEYTKAKTKGKDLQQANLLDLRNLFNSYSNYYRADEKELNDMWKDIEKYYKGELGDGWMGNASAFNDLLGGGDWYTALNSKVKWKDETKKEEFKKAYRKWASKEKMDRIKNFGNNALYSLADLGVGAYSAANHVIDFAKGLGGLALGTIENTAKKIGAMPEDTYSKLESTGPVGQWFSGIMKSSEESADMIWKDYIVDHYGSADKFVSALMDDPFGVWSDFTGLMELGLKSGAKFKIGNLGEKVPVRMGNKTVWKTRGWLAGEEVAKLDPAMWMMGAGFKADETVLKAPIKAVEYGGKTIKWVGDVSGVNNFITKLANQATGLTEEQRAFIRENPDLVQAYITGEKSIDDLTQEMIAKYGDEKAQRMIAGDLFDFLKRSDQQLDTRGMFYKLTDAFSELGATRLADGTIEFTKPLEESVKSRIKKAYEYMDSISNGTASVSDVHWAREGIGGLTKWDAGHTMTPQESMFNAAMKDVYGTIGEVLKTQVKGWADADKAYTEISRILTDFKEWFDKDGNLKDSAYGKISNLMNKNNKPKLERLLKYFPQFEKDIKALSAAKAVDRAMNATAGQYINAAMSAIGGGALFSLFTGGVGLGTVITGILAANYLTPRNFVKVLKAEGGLRRLAGGIGQKIIDKLASGKKLTEKESDAVYDYATQNREKLTKVADDLKKREELEKVDKKGALDKLEERRNELKKQLKEGKISRMEYNEKMDAIEYDISQLKTKYKVKDVEEASKEKGDTEYVVSEEEGKRLKEKYITPLEKKLGFREDTEAALKKEVENAEKQGGSLRGYAKVKEKLYALTKNPTSTTAQHEFFHAVFSVVDEKSARYILNEAKRIMKEYGMTDLNAEERLAESFGTYAKRKDVKLGILDKPTTAMGKFRAAVNDLFQKAYEWIQNYNGDRKTINKMFNEILKDEWVLDANGKLDLSYLLDDTNPGGLKNKLGLESKASKELLNKSSKRWYKSSDLGGVTFKKDITPKKPKDNGGVESGLPKVRYKKDINGKEVQIDTKATSPDQLAKINSDGLSVMKSFISEKQAEKALDVSKELLDDKGNPYLWTHTNKYTAQPFTAFENFGDSKYKEFVDKEIAWVTNNEYMSKSYANWDTILADTKPTTIKEINDKTLKTEKSKGVDVPLGKDKSLKANTTYENGEELIKNGDKYELVKRNKMVYEFDASVDKILDDIDVAKEGYTWDSAVGEEEKTHPLTKEERIERLKFRIGGSYSWGKYDVEVKELPNGKTQITKSWKDGEVLKSFDSKAAALADVKASNKGRSKYHYQGIVQDIKKPLVVDMKGEGGASFWNRLGNAYEFLKKNDEAGLKKLEEVNKKFTEDVKKYNEAKEALDQEARKIKQGYNKIYLDASEPLHNPKLTEAERNKILSDIEGFADDNSNAVSAQQGIYKMLYGYEKDLNPLVMDWVKKHSDFNELYGRVKDFISKNEDLNMLGNTTSKALISRLEGQGVDGATASLLHGMWYKGLQTDFIRALQDKSLQTNDYVFYALRKGGYDGVLFKNIVDYGAEPKGGWGMAEGGDVLAAFKSKNFKAWDNANPTDSKYISYKKDAGLKAKNGYKIDENAKTPEQLVKDVNGASEMVSFISEKQAKMAHDVSKDLLSKDGNPYMWMHTNKYNDKMFSDFKATRDSKYSLYTSKDIAWFSNSNNITQSYAEGKSKLAPTKKFNSIEEFNKYADKNVLDDGWKIQRYGDEKEITKSQIAEWNGKYVPHTISTYENKFDTLADAYAHFNDDGLMKNRGVSTKIGELPADPKEAVAKLEKYIKAKEGGDIKIKGNAEKLSSKIDIETKFDNYNTLGYFDNKNDALAEAYQKTTPSDYYTYKGIITNMKKPYVVDYSDYKFGKYWNKLGTLTDFAKREGGDKIAKAIDYVNHYDNLKYDLIDFLENGKKDLLGDDGKYIEGNMIEDKDYFLTNIIRNIREGTVDTLLSDGAWKGDEFASIKDDIVHGTKTYGDLYDMLQHLKGNTGLGFMEDYGTLPEVLNKLGVSEGVKNTLIQKLIDREYFDGAPLSYGDRIEIKGIRDLIKKLGGINLETNDYVKYAINNGDYDGVVFKNIIDYGGTPKEGWDKAEPGDVAVTFNSKQFKSWDNANPTESRYISYKKDVGLSKKNDNSEGIKYKRGYHGTSALFNKFDSSHMGEGEGAQAHGWGHYIAVNRKTGEYYAQGKNEYTYNWDKAKSKGWKEQVMVNRIIDDINNYGGTPKEAIEATRKGYEAQMKGAPEALQKSIQADLDTLNKIDADNFNYNGDSHLYEIDVPDPIKKDTPTGKNYWEEGGTITNKQFSKIADKLKEKYPYQFNNPNGWNDDYLFGQFLNYRQGGFSEKMNGREIYNMISEIVGSDKEASKFLESLGYDGIHYYGGRDGEAYVIFGDDTPQITKRLYKKDIKGLSRKDMGLKAKDQTQTPEFKKWFKGSKVVDKEGKPLEVIHETYWDALSEPKGKAVFDKNMSESGGFWFSDIGSTPGYEYGDNKLKVYLKMQNPNIVKSEYFPGRSEIIAAAQKKGYDGAIRKGKRTDGKDYTVYYVNEPNQIKSATDNIGTFDKNNPDIRYKKAYHGSPADFDKFDSSHMGEGEGAQAHGWGHYVAVEERTGRHYAGMGGEPKNEVTYKGRTILEHSLEEAKAERGKMAIMGKMDEGKSFEDAKKFVLDEYKGYVKRWKEMLKNGNWDKVWWDEEKLQKAIKEGEHIIETAEDAKKSDFKVETRTKRNLYELEIPDPVKRDTPTGSNYLEEGVRNTDPDFREKFIKPEQVDKFVDALKNYDEVAGQKLADKMYYKSPIAPTMLGGDMYKELSRVLGSDKEASKFLESIGYDGIHYYGGRDGEAYVLFNDDAPQIQNHIRYKKAYHGGGKFDKFDLSHVGEGEGNKAHGYGLYFTENEARAREYGDLYRNNKYGLGIGGGNGQFVTYKGKTLNQIDGEYSSIIRRIIEGMQNNNDANPYYTAEAQIAAARRGLRGQQMVWNDRGLTSKGSKEKFNKEMAFLDSLNPKDFKVQNEKRNLYEVDVPEIRKADTPTKTNYLEEGDIVDNDAYKIINDKLFKETGNKMQRWSSKVDGKTMYSRLSEALGGDKQASEFLRDMGYDGIHYIGKEDGSSYVLFNDNAPQIQKHIAYKKDVNSEGKKLSEGQIKHFEYSKARNDKGELIPVYRGTKNIEGDFFKWSEDHQTGDNYGKAFYFTTNKHQAEGYAHITDKDPRWIKYDAEHKGLLKKFKETRSNEDMEAFLNHGKDYDVWGDMDNNPSKYPEAMGEVKEYYLNIENPLEYDAKGERYFRVYDNLFKQARDNGNDGIIIKNVIDNSVTKDGKGEVMDVFVTFNENQAKFTDNLNPTTSDNKRFKKDVNGLSKKDNGLRKKADIQQKTSSLGRHKSEIDSFARQLGVTGDTPLQKMKQMNKIIKDPKYQGTKIKKDLYALKWDIKKEYILDNNKKIKDRGPNNTKLVVWQNGEKATWHFIPSQYYELKRMGVLE